MLGLLGLFTFLERYSTYPYRAFFTDSPDNSIKLTHKGSHNPDLISNN
jgi:hypothetical protein